MDFVRVNLTDMSGGTCYLKTGASLMYKPVKQLELLLLAAGFALSPHHSLGRCRSEGWIGYGEFGRLI